MFTTERGLDYIYYRERTRLYLLQKENKIIFTTERNRLYLLQKED